MESVARFLEGTLEKEIDSTSGYLFVNEFYGNAPNGRSPKTTRVNLSNTTEPDFKNVVEFTDRLSYLPTFSVGDQIQCRWDDNRQEYVLAGPAGSKPAILRTAMFTLSVPAYTEIDGVAVTCKPGRTEGAALLVEFKKNDDGEVIYDPLEYIALREPDPNWTGPVRS